jgi:hypothetical protein
MSTSGLPPPGTASHTAPISTAPIAKTHQEQSTLAKTAEVRSVRGDLSIATRATELDPATVRADEQFERKHVLAYLGPVSEQELPAAGSSADAELFHAPAGHGGST